MGRFCLFQRIIEFIRLEKTSKTIESNCCPSSALFISKPCPSVSHLPSYIPPGVVTPPLSWTTCSNDFQSTVFPEEQTSCFFLATIPLHVGEVHSFSWLWRGRGTEKEVEIKSERDLFATIQASRLGFFSFLEDSIHISQGNQTYSSPSSHNSVPGRERTRHKYNLIASSMCDICARRWVMGAVGTVILNVLTWEFEFSSPVFWAVSFFPFSSL